MRIPLFLIACLAAAAAAGAGPVELRERSVSSSRQVRVYSTDVPLRSQVASFAEDVKASMLGLVGESDRWKYPILVTLDKASPDRPDQAPVSFFLAQVEEGFKVEIDVHIGDDPAAVNLQKHLMHAFLMEFAYREKPAAVRGGEAYADAPWWLVEGALQMFRRAKTGLDTDVFKRIIDTNKLPPIADLLADRPEKIGGDTALAINQACAMCLVQLLIDQPNGRQNLAHFLQHIPESTGDRVAALLRDFPSLENAQNLQKWWTLNLARFSAANRYQGLSPEATDAELVSLLQFEVPLGKGDEKKSFGVGDFDEYLKLPASRVVLAAAQSGILALSTHSNVLFRSVLTEYDQILGLLSKGKTHGIKDRLAKVERYRSTVIKRNSDIADYMNWFEATQLQTRSDSFEGYLKAANELTARPKRTDPISTYLDEIAGEL